MTLNLTRRSVKGSPLTAADHDSNLDKIEQAIEAIPPAPGTDLSYNTATRTIASSTGADAVLPVASATDAGLQSAADKAKLDGIASGATANASDAQLRDRATHTGTQGVNTISGLGGAATLNVGTTAGTVAAGDDSRITGALQASTAATTYQPLDSDLTAIAALSTTSFGRSLLTQADAAAARTTLGAGTGNGTVTAVTGTAPIVSSGGATPAISISAATTSAAGSMSAADKTKLDGIAAGATANATDAQLRDRSTHTGTQAGNTITGGYTAAGLTLGTSRLLGRSTAGTGAAEEISIGANLTLSGGVLSASVTGGGGGTVTSVGLSLPGMFSVSGSPVTTAGTLSATLANQNANVVLAGPATGSAAAPTFRALVNADLPSSISLGNIAATAELTLPSGAPGTPTARDLYAVADTLRYRDSTNSERLLLNATDNLANLANTATARTNLGLGDSATRNVGTTSTTVAQGNAGMPTGGTTGQVLTKSSATDYAASWQTPTGTDLSYTASTRLLESSTGADVTLPLVSGTEAGLAPASGGGTTNFLRADGTWAAPAGGGGGGSAPAPGYQTFANGSLVAPFNCTGALVAAGLVSGRVYYSPIYIPASQTFTQILCRTNTTFSGTADVYLGVYDHNAATNRPSNKVYDSGLFQITPSGQANYGPGTISLTLGAGFYWLAMVVNASSSALNFVGPATSSRGIGFPWFTEYTTAGLIVATVFQASTTLPASASAAASGQPSIPVVFLGV